MRHMRTHTVGSRLLMANSGKCKNDLGDSQLVAVIRTLNETNAGQRHPVHSQSRVRSDDDHVQLFLRLIPGNDLRILRQDDRYRRQMRDTQGEQQYLLTLHYSATHSDTGTHKRAGAHTPGFNPERTLTSPLTPPPPTAAHLQEPRLHPSFRMPPNNVNDAAAATVRLFLNTRTGTQLQQSGWPTHTDTHTC